MSKEESLKRELRVVSDGYGCGHVFAPSKEESLKRELREKNRGLGPELGLKPPSKEESLKRELRVCLQLAYSHGPVFYVVKGRIS